MNACAPLHRTYDNAVLAFARFLEEQAVNGAVPVDRIRALADRLVAEGGELDTHFSAAEALCISQVRAHQLDAERHNYLGRIIAKRLAHLLDDPSSGILRDHLGQLFVAIRLILGDQVYSALQGNAATVAREWAGPDGAIDWDGFYGDSRVHDIRDRVRFALARAFQRFQARKDWFLTVMNSHPHARSVGPGSFVLADAPQISSIPYFGEPQLVLLVDCLLAK
ncbi:hypothetical protein [Magnetospirillum moscoviense]|uniref:Uncharacterized protein n=1 Tax=Magnetospirillum moscoviense TaxID=1437059 RepID=A0A178MDF5_9PROT|nr:hypothetical protein [Magnetospirillum moscoviense]OAN46799.1 hypothetical protein A6A05_16140 [Magnetospirillum moscoviense]